MAVGTAVAAHADDGNPTPGATVTADPSSPTGYTAHFVYYDATATSIRFEGDMLLKNWADTTDKKVYQPQEYKPGLMRGGGAYDVQMTNNGNGYWTTDVPVSAGANQYWFYRNNDTNNWLPDPTNPPANAPDGLTGSARRSFNKLYVPYDPVKQDFAPMEARQIENYRPDVPHGTWSYVPITIGGGAHTIGVYLPPGYDPDRAQPYKTIYLLHGSGQDQSDWMNMGDAPTIMDNEIADGATEPAIIVTPNQGYLGGGSFPNIESTLIPFVESHYNVSTDRMDRAWAGLSMGASATVSIINNNPERFGYYGVWSFGAAIKTTTANLKQSFVDIGCGLWDNLNLCPTQSALNALDGKVNYKFNLVAGGHDFNTWDQELAIFLKSYVWNPGAFVNSQIPVDAVVPESANGALVLTVADFGSGLNLGAPQNAGDRLRFSAELPQVTVTDSRTAAQAAGGGWAVSGQAGAFGSQYAQIGAANLGWTPHVDTPRSGLTAGDAVSTALDGGQGLSVASQLASASDQGRYGSAKLGAGLVFEVPVDTRPGDYHSSVTVSLFPVD